MILIKTCFVPHENANLIFPIIEGKALMEFIWVWRPNPRWKKISRGIYLKRLKLFRKERRQMMMKLGSEFTPHCEQIDLIFGVENNKAPSLWEMVNTWRKDGPRHFDVSL